MIIARKVPLLEGENISVLDQAKNYLSNIGDNIRSDNLLAVGPELKESTDEDTQQYQVKMRNQCKWAELSVWKLNPTMNLNYNNILTIWKGWFYHIHYSFGSGSDTDHDIKRYYAFIGQRRDQLAECSLWV